jgi:valine--pyruvate aminotransferase
MPALSSLSGPSGIQELMDDLGSALTEFPDMRMLGGGQPAAIPAVQALWRERMECLLRDGAAFDKMLLNYDPPGGNPVFREAFATFLRRECGWDVTRENIAVMPSSQCAMFTLFNLLGGPKKILFPLMPDYIGYANQALTPGMFTSRLPVIEELGPHEMKYRIDFQQLAPPADLAGIALSCPTNPTGNVITNDEFLQLKRLAQERGVPLMLDCAYGFPFPNVVYTGFEPRWEPGLIFSISMSKIGLPGVRNAVVVADAPTVKALSNTNAIMALSNGNVGQTLMLPLLADDTLLRLSREVVRPHYQQRSEHAVAVLQQALAEQTEWALHAREGAFFLWLWLKRLHIPAKELYQRLKARRVLVIPGHYFAFGLEQAWPHADQCLRITFSQKPEIVEEGLHILAEEAIAASA